MIIKALKALWPLPVISLGVFFLLSPALWSNPIGNFIDLVTFFGPNYSTVPEYFLGGFAKPVYYMATYVFVTTPVLLLAFFGLGVVIALREHDPKYKLLLLWFFVPLIVYSLFTFRQAGPRYVFMIYPALAILAAVGIMRIADGPKKNKKEEEAVKQ